jgi:hypothetical protein
MSNEDIHVSLNYGSLSDLGWVTNGGLPMGLVTAIMMLIGFAMVMASVFYRVPDAPPVASLYPKTINQH